MVEHIEHDDVREAPIAERQVFGVHDDVEPGGE
jgi:hypothetical protein